MTCRAAIKKIASMVVFLTGLFTHLANLSAGETMAARAVIKANAEATVSVFLSARVRVLPFRAGQTFKKGDLLIGFDCARYKAELAAKKAVLQARAVEARNNKRLLKHQAIGAAAVDVSIAKKAEAAALVRVQEALVGQCEVRAPFDGRVVERLINQFETPGANRPLIKIVDEANPLIELIVPSRWLGWLRPGTPFSLKVDETGKVFRAKISRIGAVVDAVSQTIRVTGQFEDGQNSVLPGMSGTARFTYSGS